MAVQGAGRMIRRTGHVVDIQRPAATLDKIGAGSVEWQTIFEGVRAWVQPVAAQIQVTGRQRQMIVTHWVYFCEDPMLETGDRILFDGRELAVTGVEDIAGVGRLWKAECMEQK